LLIILAITKINLAAVIEVDGDLILDNATLTDDLIVLNDSNVYTTDTLHLDDVTIHLSDQRAWLRNDDTTTTNITGTGEILLRAYKGGVQGSYDFGPDVTIRSGQLGGNLVGEQMTFRGDIFVETPDIPVKINTHHWQNLGTIHLNGGRLEVGNTDTPFTFADLGHVQRNGGEFRLTGLFDNQNQTLLLNNQTGSWHLYEHAKITGGTIRTQDDAQLILGFSDRATANYGLRFDSVSFDTDLDLYRTEVHIQNEINLQNNARFTLRGDGELRGHGPNYGHSDGVVRLTGNGSITFGDGSGDPLPPLQQSPAIRLDQLHIGPGVTLRTDGLEGLLGVAEGRGSVNQGLISSETPGKMLGLYFDGNSAGSNLVNEGTIQAINGGQIKLSDGYIQTAGLTQFYEQDLLGSPANTNLHLRGGVFRGNASALVNIHNTGGAIQPHDPDDPLSTLTLQFGYNQSDNGKIVLDLGGAEPRQNDMLRIFGDANILGGELQFNLIRNFERNTRPTDVIDVISVSEGDMNGQFDNVAPNGTYHTPDGSFSATVHYGPESPFDPKHIVIANITPHNVLPRRTIHFQGDVPFLENTWNAGDPGANTNWAVLGDDTPEGQTLPHYHDTLVIDQNSNVTQNLVLNQPFEIEKLVVEAVDFGVIQRDVASSGFGGGSLRLGVGGIEVNFIDQLAENAHRNVSLSAPIELTADTIIKRNGTLVSGANQRKLNINASISRRL
jgi:hypothetical protein